MKIAVKNSHLAQENKSFTQKKDWLTNQKDVLIAEKCADKRTEKNFMMLFAHNAEQKQKFRLNQSKEKKSIAKSATHTNNNYNGVTTSDPVLLY